MLAILLMVAAGGYVARKYHVWVSKLDPMHPSNRKRGSRRRGGQRRSLDEPWPPPDGFEPKARTSRRRTSYKPLRKTQAGIRKVRRRTKQARRAAKNVKGRVRDSTTNLRDRLQSAADLHELKRDEKAALDLMAQMDEGDGPWGSTSLLQRPSAEFKAWCNSTIKITQGVHSRARALNHDEIAVTLEDLIDRLTKARDGHWERSTKPATDTGAGLQTPEPGGGFGTTTGGTNMAPDVAAPSGEASTIGAARDALTWYEQVGAQGMALADQLTASLASSNLDPETLGSFQSLISAAEQLAACASLTREVLNRNHGNLAEAIQSNPVAPASTPFYEEG